MLADILIHVFIEEERLARGSLPCLSAPGWICKKLSSGLHGGWLQGLFWQPAGVCRLQRKHCVEIWGGCGTVARFACWGFFASSQGKESWIKRNEIRKASLRELHSIFKKDVTVNSIKRILRLRRLRSQALSKILVQCLSPVQRQEALTVLERGRKPQSLHWQRQEVLGLDSLHYFRVVLTSSVIVIALIGKWNLGGMWTGCEVHLPEGE